MIPPTCCFRKGFIDKYRCVQCIRCVQCTCTVPLIKVFEFSMFSSFPFSLCIICKKKKYLHAYIQGCFLIFPLFIKVPFLYLFIIVNIFSLHTLQKKKKIADFIKIIRGFLNLMESNFVGGKFLKF